MRTVEQRRLPISISQLFHGVVRHALWRLRLLAAPQRRNLRFAQRARTTPGNPIAELPHLVTDPDHCIMLAAPATWVMNSVWLLPLGVVFVVEVLMCTGEAPPYCPRSACRGWGSRDSRAAALPDRIVSPWDASVAYRISTRFCTPGLAVGFAQVLYRAGDAARNSIAGYVMATLGSPEPADRQQLKTPLAF